MKIRFLIVTLFACTSTLLATDTRIKEYKTAADFSKGKFQGVLLESTGVLRAAPNQRTLFNADVQQIWDAASSGNDHYFAAGSPASLYQLSNGDTTLLYRDESAAIFAVAADKKGVIWFAPSPGGDLYRLQNGKATKAASFPVGYIWDLAVGSKGLFVATGNPARVIRMDASLAADTLLAVDEAHIRALAVAPDGDVYAGSSGSGLIYHITRAGKANVLYDAAENEILGLAWHKNHIWAVAGASASRVPAPRPANVTVTNLTIEGNGDSGNGNGSNPSGLPVSPVPATSGASGAVYLIKADGVARNLWQSKLNRVQSLGLAANGDALVGTGDQGRLYRLAADGQYKLILDADMAQITHVRSNGGRIWATTANGGACFELGGKAAPGSEYLAEVLDARMPSDWGSLSWQGSDGLKLAVRSGNSKKPDATWSDWQVALQPATGSKINVPAARFLQWRVTFPAGNAAMLDAVTVGYMERNVAPVIKDLQFTAPGDAWPEAVEKGLRAIKNWRESKQPLSHNGKSQKKPGYQSVRWQAGDVNNDFLSVTLQYQPVGASFWRPLVDDYAGSVYSWDTNRMPDGDYRLRLTISDTESNVPGKGLTVQRLSEPFRVDNSAPDVMKIEVVSGQTVRVQTQDAGSRIANAAWALDAGEWQIINPQDGIADAPAEVFTMQLPAMSRGQHTISFRVADHRGNTRVIHHNFQR